MLDSTRVVPEESITKAVKAIPPQQILALNDAQSSENRIHSDDIAAQYGFKGALVSGVNVFGYLTQPLVRAYGKAWLDCGIMDVVFIKPAYQDNLVKIQTETLGSESSQRNHLTCAFNEEGQLLAKLESWLPAELPAVNSFFSQCQNPGAEESQRQAISWDAIELMTPAPVYHWQPSPEDNQAHIEVQRDQSPIYQGEAAYLHPYLLLDACNKTLMRQFEMPAWIHTGSHLVLRQALKQGDKITIHSMPVDKWRRAGHEFIKLYIAMQVGDTVALEVEHTAIFSIGRKQKAVSSQEL